MKGLVLYLCDLNTPVEQPLWAQFVLAVPDVLQQRALSAERRDELQAGPGTDPQSPDHVNVVNAPNGHHVLQGTVRENKYRSDISTVNSGFPLQIFRRLLIQSPTIYK